MAEKAVSKEDFRIYDTGRFYKQVRQASVRLGLNIVHPPLGREMD